MNIYKFFILNGIVVFSAQAVDTHKKISDAGAAGALGTIAVISVCALRASNAAARSAGVLGTILVAGGALNGAIFHTLAHRTR